MRLHVKFIDFKLWKIIEHGNLILGDPITNESKHNIDFNEDDQKMISLNAKVINIFFFCLDAIKFN